MDGGRIKRDDVRNKAVGELMIQRNASQVYLSASHDRPTDINELNSNDHINLEGGRERSRKSILTHPRLFIGPSDFIFLSFVIVVVVVSGKAAALEIVVVA